MTKRDLTRHIVAWLSDLANLTAGTQPLADAKTKLGAYAGLLAEQFPPEAFCHESLEAVARTTRFFPAYAEVVTPLAAWWHENRPKPHQLAPPTPQPARPLPTEAERAAVAATVAGLAAQLAGGPPPAQADGPQRTPPLRPGPRVLSDSDLADAYRAAGAVDPRSLIHHDDAQPWEARHARR